jgi:uncharacterized membrane protein YccC
VKAPGLWQAIVHFDRTRISPWIALRNAIGIALPLGYEVFAQNPGGGVVAAFGALNVAFSDGSDPYRHRARRMLAASVLCAAAVVAGRALSTNVPAAILLSAACAFAAGMMTAVGQTPADIGNITLVTLVVFAAQPAAPGTSAISGLLALGGGLLQTALALALWPLRPRAPERRALAELYAELGRVAAEPSAPLESPPATAQATAAQQALSTGRSVESERFLALLTQAERIRLAFLALARLHVRIGRELDLQTFAAALGQSRVLAARLLHAVAASLSANEPADPHADCITELRAISEQLRSGNPMLDDARIQLDALAGQLRSALELAAHITPAGSAEFDRRESAQH